MQYLCDKITINHGGSHIDYPKWQKSISKSKKEQKKVNKNKTKKEIK